MINKTNDVVIVGAGPAGLSAALELKKLGVEKIVVVDREPQAGGIPRLCRHTGFGIRDCHRVYSGPQYASRYVRKVLAAGVEIHTSTTVTQWASPNELTYTSPDGIGSIEASAILLATGCRERPRTAQLIPGRRPQGIFTTGSLQRFLDEHKLPVGKRAVIVGAELVSLSSLLTLAHAKIQTPMMITDLPRHQIYFPFVPMKWLMVDLLRKTSVVTSTRIHRILGDRRVEAVELIDLNTKKITTVPCDTVVFTGQWIPEHELARHGGLAIDADSLGPQIDANYRTSTPGIFAAGNLLRGAETAGACALEGRFAARHIYHFLQQNTWPANCVEIQCQTPISWIYPNMVCSHEDKSLNKYLSFQVSEFCQNATIEICQRDKLLFAQKYRCLQPNRIMRMSNHWFNQVDAINDRLVVTLTKK